MIFIFLLKFNENFSMWYRKANIKNWKIISYKTMEHSILSFQATSSYENVQSFLPFR